VLLALGRHDTEVERSEQEEISIEKFVEPKAIGPALLECRAGLLAGPDDGLQNGFRFDRDRDGRVFEYSRCDSR
jgi:hypothetical protein